MNLRALIQKQISEPIWDKECMALFAHSESLQRRQVGSPLHCFILSRGKDENSDELLKFLSILQGSLPHLDNKTRLHLAVQSGEHWTACDVVVENQSLKIFILDAADIREAVKGIADAFIAKFKENVKVYVYMPDDIMDNPLEPVAKSIQKDDKNCAAFTMDHIHQLSMLDIFHEFDEAKLQGIPSSPKHYFRIDTQNIPDALAPIFVNTQSWRVLSSLHDRIKHSLWNERHKPLNLPVLTIARWNSEEVIVNDHQRKLVNNGIAKRKVDLVASARTLLEQLDDNQLQEIIANRQGYRFLESAEYRIAANNIHIIDQQVFQKAFEFLFEGMAREVFELVKGKQVGDPIFKIVGGDLRRLLDLGRESFLFRDADTALREIDDIQGLTPLSKEILNLAALCIRQNKPINAVMLVSIFRRELRNNVRLNIELSEMIRVVPHDHKASHVPSAFNYSNLPHLMNRKVTQGYRIDKTNFIEFTKHGYKAPDNDDFLTPPDGNWKAHISVNENQVGKAWDCIHPLLIKHGAVHFKVSDMSSMLDEKHAGRVTKGLQVTIYIPYGQESRYNEIFKEIERNLVRNSIFSGEFSERTDKRIGRYTSIRYCGNPTYAISTYVTQYKPDNVVDPFKLLDSVEQAQKDLFGTLLADIKKIIKSLEGSTKLAVDVKDSKVNGAQRQQLILFKEAEKLVEIFFKNEMKLDDLKKKLTVIYNKLIALPCEEASGIKKFFGIKSDVSNVIQDALEKIDLFEKQNANFKKLIRK